MGSFPAEQNKWQILILYAITEDTARMGLSSSQEELVSQRHRAFPVSVSVLGSSLSFSLTTSTARCDDV